MRTLTNEEIAIFSKRDGVKTRAAEGFLCSMGTNEMYAVMNLNQDARIYKWNAATIEAIKDGISLANKPAPALNN